MPVPTLTVGLNTFGEAPGGDWRALVDQARALEGAGVDRVVVPDHVVNGPDVADYPWGRFPTGPDGDWLEPLAVLAALSSATTTLRLGTGVLVVPARPAAVLAKTAATVDVLSGGRLDLGVGTGWQRAELAAAGVDFDRRGQLLTDTVAACRALWAGGPTTVDLPTIRLTDVHCAPRPVQDPLPVWFSGRLHDRNVDRVVRLGDGWIPIMGTTVDGLRDGATRLREAWRRAGRAGAPAVRAMTAPVRPGGRADAGALDADATAAAWRGLLDAGATDVAVNARQVAADPSDPASLALGAAALVGALADAAD